MSEVASLVSAQVELSALAAQEERLAQAELRALRAQISPHFIYNALAAVANSIHTRPEEARELLTEFAEFTRYAFRGNRSYVTLADELHYVEKYLRLEQARFGDRLDVRVSVAPEVLTAVVPVLSMQPLVENAVRHGVESAIGPCRIEILGADLDSDVELTVRDGGAGMTPEEACRGAGRKRRRDRARQRPRAAADDVRTRVRARGRVLSGRGDLGADADPEVPRRCARGLRSLLNNGRSSTHVVRPWMPRAARDSDACLWHVSIVGGSRARGRAARGRTGDFSTGSSSPHLSTGSRSCGDHAPALPRRFHPAARRGTSPRSPGRPRPELRQRRADRVSARLRHGQRVALSDGTRPVLGVFPRRYDGTRPRAVAHGGREARASDRASGAGDRVAASRVGVRADADQPRPAAVSARPGRPVGPR